MLVTGMQEICLGINSNHACVRVTVMPLSFSALCTYTCQCILCSLSLCCNCNTLCYCVRAQEAERLRSALSQAKEAEKGAKRQLLDLTSSPGLVRAKCL